LVDAAKVFGTKEKVITGDIIISNGYTIIAPVLTIPI
jgi:hypothetical protein